MIRFHPWLLSLLILVPLSAGCQHRHYRHPVQAQPGPVMTVENGGAEATPESAAEMNALQARVKGMEGEMKGSGNAAASATATPAAGATEPAKVADHPKGGAEAVVAPIPTPVDEAAAAAKAKEDAAAARKAKLEDETRRIRAVLDQMEGKK